MFVLESCVRLGRFCVPTMSQAPIPDADVQAALGGIEQQPVTDDERKNACRAIMRFKGRRGPNNAEEEASPIDVTEDWVRLYVALRRASGSDKVRFSADHLRRWRARVAQTTTVKRKVFIVKKSALAMLPVYPPDLQSWVIPQGDLDLPADIYGDDVLFVDDGYDRSKINLPGLLHLECAVKCTRDMSASCRPSGLSLAGDIENDGEGSGRPSGSDRDLLAISGLGALGSKQPAKAAPAAEQQHTQERPLVVSTIQPGSEPEKAMADIIAQTVKALGLGRWVSNDVSLPNTVEFWVRLFTYDMTKKPREESKLTEPQKGYVKFITKALYESPCSYSNLPFIVPHIVTMQEWSSDIVPPLGTALIKLREVEFDKPETEAAFHSWLQKHFTLAQMQTVYNSVMYAGFLKKRLAAHLQKAQEDQTARLTILPLLQESNSSHSEEMAAEIRIVATLDDTIVNLKEKVDLLWSTPKASHIISKWAGLTDKYGKYMPFAKSAQWPQASGFQVAEVYAVICELDDAGIGELPSLPLKSLFAECLRVRKTGNAFLLRVVEEQIVARMGATARAATSDPSEDMDLSDCKDVAKELSKQWLAAVKNVAAAGKFPQLKALQDACSRTPRRTLSDGKDHKGAPAAPAAAGADKDKAFVEGSHDKTAKGSEETPEEVDAGQENLEGAPAAPAVAPAAPAVAGAAEDKPTEEVGASADTAEGPMDQSGKLLEAGAIVLMTAKKQKHLYNGFKAEIIRVNTHNIVVSILEGPSKGEKRFRPFHTVDVVEDAPGKKTKIQQAPALDPVAPTPAAPAAEAEGPEDAEAPEKDEKPDNQCMAMFGDLDLYS